MLVLFRRNRVYQARSVSKDPKKTMWGQVKLAASELLKMERKSKNLEQKISHLAEENGELRSLYDAKRQKSHGGDSPALKEPIHEEGGYSQGISERKPSEKTQGSSKLDVLQLRRFLDRFQTEPGGERAAKLLSQAIEFHVPRESLSARPGGVSGATAGVRTVYER